VEGGGEGKASSLSFPPLSFPTRNSQVSVRFLLMMWFFMLIAATAVVADGGLCEDHSVLCTAVAAEEFSNIYVLPPS